MISYNFSNPQFTWQTYTSPKASKVYKNTTYQFAAAGVHKGVTIAGGHYNAVLATGKGFSAGVLIDDAKPVEEVKLTEALQTKIHKDGETVTGPYITTGQMNLDSNKQNFI